MKKLGILGAGWLGLRTTQSLKHFFEIHITNRTKRNIEFPTTELDLSSSSVLFNPIWNTLDVIFISASLPKENLELWIKNLKMFLGDFKGQLFLCSTTGIYPKVEGVFTENCSNDLLNLKFLEIENAVKSAFPQVNILRLGGLMGDDRYLSKYYQDKALAQPGARVNQIHYQDVVGILQSLIASQVQSGIFNLVSPTHPYKSEIYKAQTGIVTEGEKFERIISSEKLQKEIGYTFVHPNPAEFLKCPEIRSFHHRRKG